MKDGKGAKALIGLVAMALFGCGRYLPILPPEALSPKAVSELAATADATGVHISWTAPDSDLRGKRLKYIDGYKVYRKTLVRTKAPTAIRARSPEVVHDGSINTALDREVDKFGFELLTTIADHHLVALAQKREEAKSQGKISRRVRPEAESTHFNFSDSAVSPGIIYIYRIVPFNQGDLDGRVKHVVRVKFEQSDSLITLVDSSRFNVSAEGEDEDFSAQL